MASYDKSVQGALAASEARYRRLFETAQDGILLIDSDTARIDDVNPYLIDMLGYSHAEFLGKKLWEVGAFENTQLSIAMFEKLQREGYIRYENLPLVTKAGRHIAVEFVSNSYDVAGKLVIQCNIRDISIRAFAEAQLKATARGLRVLRHTNAALVHAESADELIRKTCQAVVEAGGHPLAWVVLQDKNAANTVESAAWFGKGENHRPYSTALAAAEIEHGPASMVLLTGQRQYIADFERGDVAGPWTTEAMDHGYKGCLSLPVLHAGKVIGALTIYGFVADAFNTNEIELLQEAASDLAFGIDGLRSKERLVDTEGKLRIALEQSISAIAATLEARDPYTAGHQTRVANLCVAIAREMGMDENQIHGLRIAASIHDLGKISVPSDILTKPGVLTKAERALIQEHPARGADILKGIDFPWPVTELILQHHERIDGSGYPAGLKGDQILPEAKILMVADVVEAMASPRPYRHALGIEAALAEIRAGRGRLYDAGVADACARVFESGTFAF